MHLYTQLYKQKNLTMWNMEYINDIPLYFPDKLTNYYGNEYNYDLKKNILTLLINSIEFVNKDLISIIFEYLLCPDIYLDYVIFCSFSVPHI